ncbi:hypothetical protein ZWY2020_032591 [Hordeum vulgare]|nr:hypothetical protein ZWY2020_032591 [Hordeum vulgare]
MFLLPTALGGFVNQKTIGHFVAISVNMKKQRFELLDSIKDYSEAKKILSVVARKFKKIWREIGSKIQLSPSNIDHFKEFDVHVPLQGPDTLDSAFYMYMNVKHYSEEGTTMSLTEEQAPELRKRNMYHLLSEHIGNANLVLLNCTRDMLKHKDVNEDEEMKEVQCDMVEVEIPQFAEEIDTSARDTQAVEVLEDTEDERKDDSQDLQWEHERKDPPIKSDRPPGPSKENIKIYEQRIIDERKRDAAISVPRETSKGVKRTVERNRAVRSTSCTGESLEFLRPKTLASEEEVTLFLESVSPAQVDTYNELVVKGKMDFQHFKIALVMDKAYERLTRLQSDSPDTSARQSSEITTANIISIKRPLKRSTRVYDVTNIPTFEHQHFIHMDKAKAIHDYLMSNEGQKECRNANLYKSAVCEECITGQIMLDQLQKGGKGQMEATMSEFANLVLGLEYEDGRLKEFNEDVSLQQFEATMKGINLLDKKLIMIPHNTASHHTLYVLNKYENRLDILDSLDYKKCIKKTWRHQHRSCKELAAFGPTPGLLRGRFEKRVLNEIAYIWESKQPAQDSDEDRLILGPCFGEHILKIDNPNQGVANFKMELLDQKEKLSPMYLSEKQQKKLLTTNMIFLIMVKNSHYAVYMLDRYTNKVHVIDPVEVPRQEIDEENNLDYSSLNDVEANKFMDFFEGRKNKRLKESNLYHNHKLKVNGIKFVEDIDNFDDDLEIWKVETLYILLLSEVNEVKPHAMGQEILKVLHMDEE